ncbi:MAG: endonuclease/exonuclease/phosphatase family protein [Clostridia bacterium]|nr:endonuclease/exonuclease/phosphatase family protein [Clostridia bacterium]
MKKIFKVLLCVLLAALFAVAGYVGYVLISYHRIGNQILDVEGKKGGAAAVGESYRVVSWNIGFGAYEADYGFFMDGGTQSWAWSKTRLDTNLAAIAARLGAETPDFCLVQEVDIDATRSYHTDERVPLRMALTGENYASVFAQNYDSPFLMYPILQPHGASKSGLITFSAHGMTSAIRHELPVETGLSKFLDLDRCYSVSRIPVAGGGELVLYNLHLSAYTSDGTIATEQLKRLLDDMRREYEAGNWCVAGGDFNKDLLGDSSVYFTAADTLYAWAQPIPEGTFDGTGIVLVAPLDEANPVPSCRNADGPYNERQYVLTVDGFLASQNVAVQESRVIDTGFAYSDHNPVEMTFSLR